MSDSPLLLLSSQPLFFLLISPIFFFFLYLFHRPSFVFHSSRRYPHLSQCVVNLISELQEQMCKFQEEISTRIQEKRAMEEREAQQGEPRVSSARGHSPQVGLGGSNLSLCVSDARTHNGGQTVHVGRLDGWTHLPLLPHHFFSSSPPPPLPLFNQSTHATRYLDTSTESN